jgi:hypothetical protein
MSHWILSCFWVDSHDTKNIAPSNHHISSILMNDPCGYDMHNIYPRAYGLNYTIIIHQLIITIQRGKNSKYLL